MILDGWGIAPNKKVSAIDNAHTPYIDSLYNQYPNSTLRTDGLHVGLPDGQMGNSEVGHINLGAGRIIYQNLEKINKAIQEDTFKNKKGIVDCFNYAKNNNKKLHLLGLVSDGGVHSHINHLKELSTIADNMGLKDVFIHAFTDGRDTDPKSGIGYISDLEKHISDTNVELASVTGRYFAMDRDNRWERIKIAYDALVSGKGILTDDINKEIKENYNKELTDEFLMPIIKKGENSKPLAIIEQDDVVMFFNFRTDRGRELTNVLSQKENKDYNMKPLRLHYTTLTNYDKSFNNINIVFDSKNLEDTLGEVLARNGKKQIRIAETEKYPHVTFFFSGGREELFEGEKRLLCPSPKVATYDLQPEMSAWDITNAIVPEIERKEVDFVCLNFANGDMVGHTGSLEAAILACETVDKCVKEIVEKSIENDYSCIIIADHGNCETMKNEDGSPNTSHTTNPVPFILVDKDIKAIKNGILADISPTILKMMGIDKPSAMNRNSLI